MPGEPVPDAVAELRALIARLRGVIAAKDEQIASLTAVADAAVAALQAERELRRRQELRIAELERRLDMDSSDSGTPSSKEGIGVKAARKARERKARQESGRERDKNRKRGGQPGHQGNGPERDPDPDKTETADRRRSAGPATARWAARAVPGLGGRRSSTSRSSGRSPRPCSRAWPARAAGRSPGRSRRPASARAASPAVPC